MNNVLKFVVGSILFFLIGCDSSTGPNQIITNPTSIKFDIQRENEVLATFNDFLKQYNAENKVKSVYRDSITSFLTEINFNDGVKIFNNGNISAEDSTVRIMFIDFFKQWEMLFGTSLNIGKISQGFTYELLGYLYFSIIQNELNGKVIKFANTPDVLFQCRSDGTLLKIKSSLIPDFPIPDAVGIDSAKMMEHILNKTIELNLNEPVWSNYFDTSYIYWIPKDYAVYFEKHSDVCYLYNLKVVVANKYAWEDHYAHYEIYCYPENGEVIAAKSYPIF